MPAYHPNVDTQRSPKLLERMRIHLRTRHYSIRTEEAYIDWARRFILFQALLHKARPRRHSPDPRRSYAIAIVSGVPSSVKRLSNATRTCSSVTWRSNVRAITRSPSRLKQCILVSTKLRRW